MLFFNIDDVELEPLIEPCTTKNIAETEPVYGNVGACVIPSVRVEDLWDYVKQKKENDVEGFRTEYRVIISTWSNSTQLLIRLY